MLDKYVVCEKSEKGSIMTKTSKKIRLLTGLVLAVMLLTTAFTVFLSANSSGTESSSGINRFDGDLILGNEKFYDNSVIYKLPSTVKDSDELSIIVQMKEDSLVDAYLDSDTTLSFTDYSTSVEAEDIRAQIAKSADKLIGKINKTNVDYVLGKNYDTVIAGFEMVITAKDFVTVCNAVGNSANVIVGEVYKTAETKLVENQVDVQNTGIFNSANFGYNGKGTVVAVLDTGLDYYHTAFADSNFAKFNNDTYGLTFSEVASILGSNDMASEGMQAGMSASDVYIGNKVPYAFDYADGDSDVFPLLSNHGTHVAGVIAGHDDVITGVAPGAQLAIMKIFSDVEATSRTAWILAALEDCVTLGVDVINMSIGTTCGFSRPTDEESVNGIYDKIRELGISLVVAASNSFNSTYGSDKNGNLGLTSNPDSATVGSPSTYEAAISVASIEGAKTPYLLYGSRIIYFIESTDRFSEEKDFVADLLGGSATEREVEYVTIPGVGRTADYTGIDVKGKVALIRRGETTFEEKVNVAEAQGAAGVIIYNNVSGDIKMNVGDSLLPVCSISQDDGEVLAEVAAGKIKISVSQASGPFMSDFSSWGPTPDLRIKPEITAHGGSILSAVPGQSYDRISGTSMATPNISGVSALLRQYVMERFPELSGKEINVTVNRLMMSTATITINKNGLPYSVRKQGAGLANLTNSAATDAYIITYDRITGAEMEKTKIELGDDPKKTGEYELVFAIKNFGSKTLSYDLDAYVLTEGVSETLTNKGDTTVTETAHVLEGAQISIVSIENGARDGNTVSVDAGKTAKIKVSLKLSDADKKYLDDSFENGMYVEGYLTLDAKNEGSVDLSVPYLAFYGDWTVAPILDLDYFATNKDELDDSIDLLDKTLPDAYATRPVGGTTGDYVTYLGSYYYIQNPAATQISADRKYISLSNQEDSINSLRFVWAGLLRNADKVVIEITEDSTGEVVFTTTDNDIRKAYGEGGPIRPANVDVEFSAIDQNLKNNTAYTVTMKAYVDYGNGGLETNLNNTFTFPLVTDFEAPTLTDVEFYSEYDRSAKKTRLYAKMAVYDNHYAMSLQVGYIDLEKDESGASTGSYLLNTFDQYLTPVYSDFNSTSYVTYELTDYIDDIMASTAIGHQNTICVTAYDYALNVATYEIALPTDYADCYFAEDEITLSPNEIYELAPSVYPDTTWMQFVQFGQERNSEDVIRIVDGELVAIGSGEADVYVYRYDSSGRRVLADTLTVKVLAKGDKGYKRYDKPVAKSFVLTGYKTLKAYYRLNSDDKDIGDTDQEMKFGSSAFLSMFPSESVKIRYDLDAYFDKDCLVTFQSGNERIATVTADGVITAQAEGRTSITAKVLMDGKSTYYSQTVSINVKDPFITTGPSLTNYYGLGGKVTFPSKLAVTEIGQFAFSNYDYVDKDPSEIYPGDTDTMKMWYIGDDTITEVVIPEGVERIGPYAFANLTALEKIVLPKSLETIDYGAFFGCSALKTVEGIEHVKFVNQAAFEGCNLSGELKLDSIVAIANFAFAGNTKLQSVKMASTLQSIGAYAFAANGSMTTVTIEAEKIKLGQYAFSECSKLTSISINAPVIAAGAFNNCRDLTTVNLGADVAVIGEYAFRNTKVASFNVANGNATFKPGTSGYILDSAGTTLLIVAPATTGTFQLGGVTAIGNGAFSGNNNITNVIMPDVTVVGDYAFSACGRLASVTLGALTKIGNYSFEDTAITALPSFDNLGAIGDYAFARTNVTSVVIPAGMKVGVGAFSNCNKLASVVVGDNAELGEMAFTLSENNWKIEKYAVSSSRDRFYYVYTSPLHTLTIGENVKIGNQAFAGAAELVSVTLGDGAEIGDYAFFNAASLESIDLSGALSIGENAFSGYVHYEYEDQKCSERTVVDGDYVYRYYAPKLTSVDLSSLTKLGKSAFTLCQDLTTVTLGAGLTEIPESAFQKCAALNSINLEHVTTFGESALAECALTTLALDSATTISGYAFCYNDALTSVTLPNAATIGEGAFSYCSALSSFAGEEKASYVGDYAFAHTALTEADLSAATYIGEGAFIKETATLFTVTLGEDLTDIGDNPFAMCIVAPFSTVVEETFNGKVVESTEVFTYDISDSVKIIDGSIYKVVPYGLELILWTGNGVARVADGTVRISSYAFAGGNTTSAILPYTVAAIGHKAFFACDKLVYVSFASFDAPILEEEYDYYYYASYEHIPATGDYEFTSYDGSPLIFPGIEIVPYFMWNASSLASNVYYGANFIDYVGYVKNNVTGEDGRITMVRPVNGKNYDSYIFGQYFNTVVDGGAAADDVTLEAIAAISRIPDAKDITLEHKALVEAARAAYDKIVTNEQKALVKDFARLTAAERKISDLEYLQNQGGDDVTEPEQDKMTAMEIINIVIYVLFGLTAAALGVFIFLFVKQRKGNAPATSNDDKNVNDATADEPADKAEDVAVADEAADQAEDVAVADEAADPADLADDAENIPNDTETVADAADNSEVQ